MVFVRPITDISAAHGCSRIATSVCVVSSCTYFESKAFFQIYKQVKDICADHGGRWLAGTEGSHSARGMDVCVSFVFCVLSGRGRTDRSSRGFLPSVVCLSMISKPQQWCGLGPLGLTSRKKKRKGHLGSWDGVVGIATGYVLDRPVPIVVGSRGCLISKTFQTSSGAQPALLSMGNGFASWG
jgi:hypothetical protein